MPISVIGVLVLEEEVLAVRSWRDLEDDAGTIPGWYHADWTWYTMISTAQTGGTRDSKSLARTAEADAIVVVVHLLFKYALVVALCRWWCLHASS